MALLGLAIAVTHSPVPGSLDDAFVALSDARGWARHLGLIGQQDVARPAVEGATSALDVLAKGVILVAAPGADPLRMAGWMGLVVLVATVVLASYVSLRVTGSRRGAAALAMGLATCPALIESASYLLEGPWFALGWVGLLGAAARKRPREALLWSTLLIAARPEGALLGPLGVAWAARAVGTADDADGAGGAVSGPAAALRFGALALIPVAALTALRLWLYGAWLPNTFHAKSSDSRWLEVADGVDYVARWLWTPTGAATLLLAAALGWATASGGGSSGDAGGVRRDTRSLLGLAGVSLAAVIASGGDGYLGARLLLPVPLAVWLAAASAWRVAPARVGALSLGVLAIQLGTGFSGVVSPPATLLRSTIAGLRGGPPDLGTFAGDEMAFRRTALALDGETFAHRHVQRFRWFEPGAAVLDLTGLTDADVARRPAPGPVRFGRDAVDLALEREVGAIHLDALRSRPRALVDVSLVPALSDPGVAADFAGEPFLGEELATRLAERYRAASLAVPEAGGFVNLLVRTDLAERFRQQGFRVRER